MDALAVSAATQLDSCHEQKPITGGERVRRQMSGKATYQEFEARELQNLSSAFFFPRIPMKLIRAYHHYSQTRE